MGQRLKSSHAPLLLLAIVSVSSAYRQYQSRIPNGGRVPDPCRPGESWGGVCHHNHEGGGTLNPFGKHFKLNGEVSAKRIILPKKKKNKKKQKKNKAKQKKEKKGKKNSKRMDTVEHRRFLPYEKIGENNLYFLFYSTSLCILAKAA